MLEDAAGIRRVVLACDTVDLRKGIDGLATIIGDKYRTYMSYSFNSPSSCPYNGSFKGLTGCLNCSM